METYKIFISLVLNSVFYRITFPRGGNSIVFLTYLGIIVSRIYNSLHTLVRDSRTRTSVTIKYYAWSTWRIEYPCATLGACSISQWNIDMFWPLYNKQSSIGFWLITVTTYTIVVIIFSSQDTTMDISIANDVIVQIACWMYARVKLF